MSKKNDNRPLMPDEVIAQKRSKAESAIEIRRFILKVILLILFVFAFTRFVWGFAIVEGKDMAPMLKDGDLVLIDQISHDYIKTDVVSYEETGVTHFGRVVAVAGETVDMTEAGELMINDNVVQEEDIFYPTSKEGAEATFPLTVQPGEVFILGDYRTGATDSRRFGAIQTSDINGKIIGFFRRRGI